VRASIKRVIVKKTALSLILSALLCAGVGCTQTKSETDKPAEGKPETGQAVPGEGSSQGVVRQNATSTDSAGQNTPGVQTEAGSAQQPGTAPDVPQTAPATQGNPGGGGTEIQQAGQSPAEAERNAQAAGRAEIKPGSTLGVDATQSKSKKRSTTGQTKP